VTGRKMTEIDIRKPIKVLIVDDKEEVRTALSFMFDDKDFFVEEADNGKEALENLARIRPDVILLDVAMPVMDGFQTYRRLKENPKTKNIPIIVLTARPYQEVVRDMRLTYDEYLEKPCSSKELHARIDRIIGHKKI
jgi:CheY-like chemotaxis protein